MKRCPLINDDNDEDKKEADSCCGCKEVRFLNYGLCDMCIEEYRCVFYGQESFSFSVQQLDQELRMLEEGESTFIPINPIYHLERWALRNRFEEYRFNLVRKHIEDVSDGISEDE